MSIEPSEIIQVASKRVSCDGGGALGHPLVWLEMGEKDTVECAYCDRVFQLSSDLQKTDRQKADPQNADNETPRQK